MKRLDHPHIIRLYQVNELSHFSFITRITPSILAFLPLHKHRSILGLHENYFVNLHTIPSQQIEINTSEVG